MKIVAKTLLYNPHGQILVLQRSTSHPHFPGHYDFPGGEVEKGESIPDTIIRETFEEAGVQLLASDIQHVLVLQKNSALQYVLYKSILQKAIPTVTLSWEHSSYAWLTPAELLAHKLPEKVDDYYQDVLDYLEKYE